MKRFLSIVTLFLVSLVMVGCGGKEKNDDKRITLTYSAWNLGTDDPDSINMERLMLKEFEKAYPEYKIQVIERPKTPGTSDDQPWNEFLGARASVGTLPDVFLSDNLPYYVQNKWALDLTDLVKNDSEYANISKDITDTCILNNKTMAIPSAVHYMGYVVNKSLYEDAAITAPTTETTMDQLLDSTKKVAKHSGTTGDGIVGLEGIEHILHWYPAQLNENYQWFTFDGTKYNLDSDEFVQTVNLYRELRTSSNYVLEALQDEAGLEGSTINLEEIFGTNDYFNAGNIACKWYFSYDFGWMQQKVDDGVYTWDLDFIGIPAVGDSKRVPATVDLMTIASTTKNKEGAYKLAKWMSFGKEGYAKRIELSNTVEGISKVNFAPLQNDSELLDQFFEIYHSFPGLRTIVEKGSVLLEPVKFLVGYNDVRYHGVYDGENKMGEVISKLMIGEVNITDIKTQLNTQANAIYVAAKESFDQIVANK